MKVLLCFLVMFLSSVSVVFGQKSKLRELIGSDPRLSWNNGKKVVSETKFFVEDFYVMTLRDERELEKAFSNQLGSRDFISLGIQSIEDNFDSSDIIHGLSWRPDSDMTFRLKSKLTYKYNPRQLPKDPFVFIDKVFLQPVRLIALKTLSF